MLGPLKSNTFSTGLAMFSMFFGAGNVVFPLVLGQMSQSHNHYAMIGLLTTAVLVPFLGLISMTVFDGNYRHFFSRIGAVPGLLVAGIILALIGPLGAIPRCITLSYSTFDLFLPSSSLLAFSGSACILIFVMAYRRNRLLDILGYILTPVLLFLLAFIVFKGISGAPNAPMSTLTPTESISLGLRKGYQTMDLLGAFFFSSVVLVCLKRELDPEGQRPYQHLVVMALKASIIGGLLLGTFYVGFSYLTAFNAADLAGVEQQKLLGTIALQILGPIAGVVATAAIGVACLTTAIALSAVFAQFLHEDVFRERLNYPTSLFITLLITFCVSTLQFTGIVQALAPVLEVCYPALIVLSILNLGYKLSGFKIVKAPVYLTFVISVIAHFWWK